MNSINYKHFIGHTIVVSDVEENVEPNKKRTTKRKKKTTEKTNQAQKTFKEGWNVIFPVAILLVSTVAVNEMYN